MRSWVCLLLFPMLAFAAASDNANVTNPKPETLTGKLVQAPGKAPALETPEHRLVWLDGDEPTRGVLNDKRLAGFDIQAKGHFTAPDHFLIDPIHTKAIFVNRDGRRKIITYWCDVCSIRTYTPGRCVCCQQETTLDLRDPDSL